MGENKGAASIVGEYSKKAGTMVHLTELKKPERRSAFSEKF